MTSSSGISALPILPGLIGVLAADSQATRARLNQLTQQISSGQTASDYADLGDTAGQVLTLSPSMTAMNTWQANITTANSRTDTALNAMDRISAIASGFYASIDNLNGLNAGNVDSVAASARDALKEVAGLLNTKDGNVYVFAGQDSANPPVPNADGILASGFYTQIATAVGSLSTAGASATISATLAIAGSNAPGTSPFSSYLSQSAATLQASQPAVEVAAGQLQSYGFQASANTAAVSTGTSTTGSYIRDLMRALSTLGSLSSSQLSDPGFSTLVGDTRTSLSDAITAMSTDIGIVGDQHTRLAAIKDQTGARLTIVTGQVSQVRDVDMASALSSLSQVQTQLQASYQMINAASSLTLVHYLQ